MIRILSTLTAICFVLFLSGCAAVIVGGATLGAVSVAEDERPVGVQVDDTKNQGKISYALSSTPEISDHANINVYVNNGTALLTGQAPSERIIKQAEEIVRKSATLKKIHNQIRLGKPIAITTKAHDAWLSSKVQANLYGTKDVNAFQMEVIVEDSEVFLMGQVSNTQAEKAVDIARHVGGVIKVINAFEIVR